MSSGLRLMMKLSQLKKAATGNVAIIFALSLIPIFVLLGFSIDFQQVNTNKNRVQHILDSVVIAGAREMQDGHSSEEISAYITNYFEKVLEATSASTKCDDPVSIIDSTKREVNVSIKCHQETSLLQLISINDIDFSVSSASTYGIGNVDIAFVFDVSGSMGNSGKMDALKVAAEDALTILLPDSSSVLTPGEVRIAMTSYSSMVNAGTYFKAVTNKNPTRTYTDTHIETVSTCTAYKKNGKCKTWKDVDVPTPVTKTITNTCVKERIGVDAFTGAKPGPGAWIEAAEAYFTDSKSGGSWDEETCNKITSIPLTDNKTKLSKYITDLTPNGLTAGHLGIAWGW